MVRWLRWLAVLPTLLAATAAAQLDAGPEFQVNVYTTHVQRYPAVAVQPDGGFVVTWRGTHTYEPYGASSGDVFVRRYDAEGGPPGPETLVNAFTTSVQDRPSIASSADGSFVVAWESGCYYGTDCSPDGSEVAVAARRFGADGSMGPELVVNAFATSRQTNASVAVAAGGDFVVAWHSFLYPAVPGYDRSGAYVRHFDRDDAPTGGDQPLADDLAPSQLWPSATADDTGRFVVAWGEYVSLPDDEYMGRILMRRLDVDGTPLAAPVVLAELPNDYARAPAMAGSRPDRFVVVWNSAPGIVAARIDATGARRGPDAIAGKGFDPAVAADDAGNFVVVWQGRGEGDPGEDQYDNYSGIFGQAFAHDGTPLGSEFRVNEETAYTQRDPDVAANAAGEFVVTWSTYSDYRFGQGCTLDGADVCRVSARRFRLRPCTEATACDDANECTDDACEDDRCLNRRRPGCCSNDGECDDGDACTTDACEARACVNATIPQCVPCETTPECPEASDVCTFPFCADGRCQYSHVPGCGLCNDASECDDGDACTMDVCDAEDRCQHPLVADCPACATDADCGGGCLLGELACVEKRCEGPAGCPRVIVGAAVPAGADGLLEVAIALPTDVPGKGRVKAKIVGKIGTGGDAKGRCKAGRTIGRVKTRVEPGSEPFLFLGLNRRGQRCLEADEDGALPVDVRVRIRRRKTRLTDLETERTWVR